MGKKKKKQDLEDHLFDALSDEESGILEISVDGAMEEMSDTARVLWADLSDGGSDAPAVEESSASEEASDSLVMNIDVLNEEDESVVMPPRLTSDPVSESPLESESEMAVDADATIALDVGLGGGEDEKTVPLGLEDSQTLKIGGSVTTDTATFGADEKTIAVGNAPRLEDSGVSEKVSFGFNPASGLGSTPHMGSHEAALVQAENLRIAQERILDLEKEVEHLRRENEQLASAGESLKSTTDELSAQNDQLRAQLEDQKESYEGELTILRESMSHKDRLNLEARKKVDELEQRLNNDLKKIRVRERELEHRLELIKMENEALARNKDETILGLKRQQDQLSHESEGYRSKMQDLYRQLGDNQDRFRRTVRALRLALSNLELADDANIAMKKVD